MPLPLGTADGRSVVRWEYRCVFSDCFTVISSGEVKMFDADGAVAGTPSTFPDKLKYVREHEKPTTIVGHAYMQEGIAGELGTDSLSPSLSVLP